MNHPGPRWNGLPVTPRPRAERLIDLREEHRDDARYLFACDEATRIRAARRAGVPAWWLPEVARPSKGREEFQRIRSTA